jgi:hypothetical protein
MNSSEDIFAAVARAASEHGLPILVIGGHAVNAYGYTRTTLDADFLICAEDHSAWRRVFEEAGYRWQMETDAFIKLRPPEGRGDLLPVDVMLVDGETFARLLAEGRELQFGKSALAVPKPLHLIALKLHAMRNPERFRTGKDLLDILHLVRICRIDPTGPEFLETIERYADEKARRLLEAHLQSE